MSTAVTSLTSNEMLGLLERSRVKNERLGITGMMLSTGDHFIQAIEGPEESVDTLFASIQADSRHHSPFVLRRDRIEDREFALWLMSCREIPETVAHRVEGFTEYAYTGSIGSSGVGCEVAGTFHDIFRANLA